MSQIEIILVTAFISFLSTYFLTTIIQKNNVTLVVEKAIELHQAKCPTSDVLSNDINNLTKAVIAMCVSLGQKPDDIGL